MKKNEETRITDRNIGKVCVIRADPAGVFFGTVVEQDYDIVVLKNVRRIWYWDGAASLSQMALEGVKKPGNCKFSVTIGEETVLGVIEVIPASKDAIKSIIAVPDWKA